MENPSGTEYDNQSHIVKDYGISENIRDFTKDFYWIPSIRIIEIRMENPSGTEYDNQSHTVKDYGISENIRGSTKDFTGFILSE